MQPDKTDTALKDRVQNRLWDVPAATVLLTRLPVPALPEHAFAHPARSVWAYPLVGLVLGALGCVILGLCQLLSLPGPVTAGLVLAALVVLTGAMHEDGLADTADGLWGGQSTERRLEIMKDSRIGAYGVLALIIAMGLRWLGLAEITWTALLTAMIVSRAMMPPLMIALPHARSVGLSHSVGTPTLHNVGAAVFIGSIAAVLLSGGAGLIAVAVAMAVTASIGMIAHRKIRGQTGDILGATQICTEIAILIVLIP